MKRISSILFTAIILAAFVTFFSCSKDEEIDLRDQLLGNYYYSQNITTKFSEIALLDLEDETEIFTGILTITKNNKISDEIIITDDDNVTYKANAITEASNGVTFNIPYQIIVFDEGNIEITGFTCYILDNMKYDGGYESNTKTLTFGFEGIVNVYIDDNLSIDIPFEVITIGTKS